MNLSDYYKKYSDVNWAIADQAMVSGINFVTGILLAKYLGINKFGTFTLIYMPIIFITSLQMALISSPMLSLSIKQRTENRKLYYSALFLQQIIFSILSFCFLFGATKLYILWYFEIQVEIIEIILPISTIAFLVPMQEFFRRLFFSQNRHIVAFLIGFVRYVTQLILLFYFFYSTKLEVNEVLWVICLTSFASILIALFFYKNWSNPFKLLIDVFYSNWLSAKWMTLSVVLQWLSGNVFFITTAILFGSSAVGALKATQNLLAVINVMFLSMENFIPRRLSCRLNNAGLIKMYDYCKSICLLGLVITIVLSAIISAFAEQLLIIIYDKSYIQYINLIYGWSIVYIVLFLTFPLKAVLRTIEKTRGIVYSLIISSIFSIFSANHLIEKFGLLGAILGIALANSIIAFILFINVKYHLDSINTSKKDFKFD